MEQRPYFRLRCFLPLLSCSSYPCLSFSVYVINRFLTNLVTKENLTYFKLVINHLWTLPQKYITFFLSHFEKRRGISYPFLDALIKVKSFAGKPRLTYKVYKKVCSCYCHANLLEKKSFIFVLKQHACIILRTGP